MKGRAGAHTVPLSEWSKQDFPMFRRFAFVGTARLPIRAPNGVSVRMEWKIPPHSGTSDQRVIWADQAGPYTIVVVTYVDRTYPVNVLLIDRRRRHRVVAAVYPFSPANRNRSVSELLVDLAASLANPPSEEAKAQKLHEMTKLAVETAEAALATLRESYVGGKRTKGTEWLRRQLDGPMSAGSAEGIA